jgi:hypothetical protein
LDFLWLSLYFFVVFLFVSLGFGPSSSFYKAKLLFF